jgi:hypothetical protein
MGDLNARCGDLIPTQLMKEEGENGWYKDNSFAVSSRRSEDKVVNEEGRKLISFCEILNLEILNGSRVGDVEGKITFVSKTGTSVIDYILCSYDIGRCLKTFRVRDMAISDHNIIETVMEVEDNNKADKMNKYYSKQLRIYKWYERKKNDFEQRRDGKSTEIFVLGVEYFLCRREIKNAVRVLSDMLRNVAWQMEKRGNEGKDWRGWYSDECRRGKEMVMKALNKWARGKTCENRYELVERKGQYKEIMGKEKKNGKIGMQIILKACLGKRMHNNCGAEKG